MSLDSPDMIRISLPDGTQVQTGSHTYTTGQILSMDERSVTVLCTDENGKKQRLKFFNGTSSVTQELLREIAGVSAPNVIRPSDVLLWSGKPAAVYDHYPVQNAGEVPVPLSVLRDRIIPGLAQILRSFHSKQILLRDICPEHILYRPDGQFMYTGFGNPARLEGKATVTKEQGFGQEACYIAPEVEQAGYSIYSDYYALGVTILALLKGKNPLKGMTPRQIGEGLSRGAIPGLDMNALRAKSWQLYSEEDRILYLVAGLLIPSPANRWAYGEIRCWANHQQIPLVRKEGRIAYQFNAPFQVGSTACWNVKQIASTLAADGSSWTQAVYQKLLAYFSKQFPKLAQAIGSCTHSGMSGESMIFRSIYTMSPKMDGLWWKGKKYANLQQLTKEASAGGSAAGVLRQLIRDEDLSFFWQQRGSQTPDYQKHLTALRQIESWEKESPDKGFGRCLMLYAGSSGTRSFQVENVKYENVETFIDYYKDNGKHLKSISAGIISDKGFQSWLWSKGAEKAGSQAASMVSSDPGQAFYVLLGLCESLTSSDSCKRMIRGLYLKWGEYAHINWLLSNTNMYKASSAAGDQLLDVLKKTRFDLGHSLADLSSQANRILMDYQNLAGAVSDNPFDLGIFPPEADGVRFYPVSNDGFFCCKWEGYEVCPAFLRSIKESVPEAQVRDFADRAAGRTRERLNDLKSGTSVGTSVDEGSYLSTCTISILAGAALIVLAIFFASRVMQTGFTEAAAAGGIIACIFPVVSILHYLNLSSRARVWFRKNKDAMVHRNAIDSRLAGLDGSRNSFVRDAVSGTGTRCRIADQDLNIGSSVTGSPASTELEGKLIYLAQFSAAGLTFLAGAATYMALAHPGWLAAYIILYVLVLPHVVLEDFWFKDTVHVILVFLIPAAVLYIGGMMTDPSFVQVAVAVPVGIVVGVFILSSIF